MGNSGGHSLPAGHSNGATRLHRSVLAIQKLCGDRNTGQSHVAAPDGEAGAARVGEDETRVVEDAAVATPVAACEEVRFEEVDGEVTGPADVLQVVGEGDTARGDVDFDDRSGRAQGRGSAPASYSTV